MNINMLFIFLMIAGRIVGNVCVKAIMGPGSTLRLSCHSSDPVRCIWKRNGMYVAISYRYRYLDGNGPYRNNCSIEIMRVLPDLDYGNWSCWSLSDDGTDGRLLNSSNIVPSTAMGHEKVDFVTRANLGDSIDIWCEFPIRIYECHWLRNEEPVIIKNRYYGTNTREGMYSTDCSIAISKVRSIDAGSWQCTTATNDWNGYLRAEKTWLIIEGPNTTADQNAVKPTIHQHPENVMVDLDGTANLKCEFFEPVRQCGWLRNGHVLQVHYRYGFADHGTGKNTANCSLEITNVKHEDFGSWQCLSLADDSHDTVASNVGWLIDARMTSQPNVMFKKTPENVIAALGTTIKGHCEFDHKVDCIWLRNGMALAVEGRYRYVGPEGGQDTKVCDIEIINFQEMDPGKWSCGYMANSLSNQTLLSEMEILLYKRPSDPEMSFDGESIHELDLVMVNQSFELACGSVGGSPAPHLYWTADGQPLAESNSQTATRSLEPNGTISSHLNLTQYAEILKNHSQLSCIVKQSDFNVTLSRTIPIRNARPPSGPNILWNDTNTEELDLASFGSLTPNLSCVSARGYPAPTLHWEVSGLNVSGTIFQKCHRGQCNVTLKWNDTMDMTTLGERPDQLRCIAEHPELNWPAATSVSIKMPSVPLVTTKVSSESLTTIEVSSESLTTTKEPSYSLATIEVSSEPLTTTKEPSYSLATIEVSSEPLTTTKEPRKSLATIEMSSKPLTTTNAPNEPLAILATMMVPNKSLEVAEHTGQRQWNRFDWSSFAVPKPPQIWMNDKLLSSWMESERFRKSSDLQCAAESDERGSPDMHWEWLDPPVALMGHHQYQEAQCTVLHWNWTSVLDWPVNVTRLDCVAKYPYLVRPLRTSIEIRRSNGTGADVPKRPTKHIAKVASFGILVTVICSAILLLCFIVVGCVAYYRYHCGQKKEKEDELQKYVIVKRTWHATQV